MFRYFIIFLIIPGLAIAKSKEFEPFPDDPYFENIEVPEKWQNESAIVLAKKQTLRIETPFFKRYHNVTSVFRKKILLQDQAAIDDYSELVVNDVEKVSIESPPTTKIA